MWFALRVSFPTSGTVDWFAILLCAAAFVALLRYKVDIFPVIICAGILGVLHNFILG
jgi:chromate transporter